jgi:hypothetical protein
MTCNAQGKKNQGNKILGTHIIVEPPDGIAVQTTGEFEGAFSLNYFYSNGPSILGSQRSGHLPPVAARESKTLARRD